MKVKIYTDGSAKGNPGPGGYGIVMKFNDSIKEFAKGYRLTTNNRMELLAVITALENMKTNQYPIQICHRFHYQRVGFWLENERLQRQEKC
jgi:ribonuclease HI